MEELRKLRRLVRGAPAGHEVLQRRMRRANAPEEAEGLM